MARVRSRRSKSRTGLDLTPEQECEARRALGQGPPSRREDARASAFPTKAALRAATAAIEGWDTDNGLGAIRARRALYLPDPIEHIASIQGGRRRWSG